MDSTGNQAREQLLNRMFSAGFIPGSRDFTAYFFFLGVARTIFDTSLIHSLSFLVMARAGFFFLSKVTRNTPEEKIRRKIK